MNIATMRRLEQSYKKISRPIEELLFPVVLLLWPLVKFNQGIDVTDSTYSLGNFLYADKMQGTWVLATFLSNTFGSLLVRLPGGDTLLGINIYTGLIISAIALVCYYGLRKEFTAPVVFVAEFLSISFCWIPSGILYNYLTYLLFAIGSILIYYGIKQFKTLYFYFAGMILGLNVFIRIPNVVEAGLILVVWISVPLILKKEDVPGSTKGGELMGITGACMVGYIIGLALPMAAMASVYGSGTFEELFIGLNSLSESNNEYTAASMLYRTFNAYMHSLKWPAIMVAVTFSGTLMMAVLKNNRMLKWCGRIVYLGVIALMLRFFWGRGMFSFRYYEDYTAMYEWGMIILFLAWLCVVTVLIRRNYNILVKTYALLVLMILLITPLGSNNYTMQNINNLFLVLPFVLFVTGGWLYKGVHRFRLENVLYGCNFPWMSMILVIFAVVMIQTVGFHMGFVFKDGMDGTPRESFIAKTAATESVADIMTTEYNARTIKELCDFIHSESSIKAAVYWGNCPGLSYILRLPPEIGSSWPDLDSYLTEKLEEELMVITDRNAKGRTAVIWRNYTEYSGNNTKDKETILNNFINENHMRVIFENEEFKVYR